VRRQTFYVKVVIDFSGLKDRLLKMPLAVTSLALCITSAAIARRLQAHKS
jgi:hypothetical protein